MESEASWSSTEIEEQFRLAGPLMRELQRTLATAPDTEFTAAQMADRLGITRSRMGGVVGAYSGQVYRRWGRNRWPFDVRREQSPSQTYYCMPTGAAAVIASIED